MIRRKFLKSSLILFTGLVHRPRMLKPEKDGKFIMTVLGAINAKESGVFLPHEHLMSTFGADEEALKTYNADKIYNAVFPYLKTAKQQGCNTIADCTAAFFGRDPQLLKRLSSETGINILTNTGYYGAANDKYVPAHAFNDTPGVIAEKWINEFLNGIESTGIKPGFIKTGVDGAPLSEIDRKLVEASCIAHLKTGLTIASHTGGTDGKAALEQLEILKTYKVHPSAWIWVHAQNCKDSDVWFTAAKRGAWIELDAVNDQNFSDYIQMINKFKKMDLLSKVLLSHDGDTYQLGQESIRLYQAIFTKLIPALRQENFSEAEINQLTVINPQKAFSIRKRGA